MIGSYLIIAEIKSDKIEIAVGRLGILTFRSGIYVYVGSAQGKHSTSLKNRVLRHLRSNFYEPSSSFSKPKIHWHIDYFLCNSFVSAKKVMLIPSINSNECDIAEMIMDFADSSVEKFGCSDCKCTSHLFYISEKNPLYSVLV